MTTQCWETALTAKGEGMHQKTLQLTLSVQNGSDNERLTKSTSDSLFDVVQNLGELGDGFNQLERPSQNVQIQHVKKLNPVILFIHTKSVPYLWIYSTFMPANIPPTFEGKIPCPILKRSNLVTFLTISGSLVKQCSSHKTPTRLICNGLYLTIKNTLHNMIEQMKTCKLEVLA